MKRVMGDRQARKLKITERLYLDKVQFFLGGGT